MTDNTHVFGRTEASAGPSGRLGRFRATDGSAGTPVGIDFDRPHTALVVGKRGSGKSTTLGVIAEELATSDGVAPVLIDPMGEFEALPTGVDAAIIDDPQIPANELTPRSWCRICDLDPTSPSGSLVWRAAECAETLSGMRDWVSDADATQAARRAAANHLRRAATWDRFDPDGLQSAALRTDGATVLSLAGGDRTGGAVLAVVAHLLYRSAATAGGGPLPWLLVDEAARLIDGVAADPIERVLTQGRTPGVSLVLATQRPGALPTVAVSQADLLIAHRLTAASDLEALERARPTYLRGTLRDRLPAAPGAALVVDEATERAATVAIRRRRTPHGGATPRAVDRA